MVAGEHLVGLPLILGQIVLRLHGSLFAAFGKRVAGDLGDHVLHDLGHGRTAEQTLQVGHRHLAGTKSLDTDFILERIQALDQTAVEFGRGYDDLEFALQPIDQGLGYLHFGRSILCSSLTRPIARPSAGPSRYFRETQARDGWCGRRDLNPHDFRHGNLNPARLPVPPRPLGAISRTKGTSSPIGNAPGPDCGRGPRLRPGGASISSGFRRSKGKRRLSCWARCARQPPSISAKTAGSASGKSSAMSPRPIVCAAAPCIHTAAAAAS